MRSSRTIRGLAILCAAYCLGGCIDRIDPPVADAEGRIRILGSYFGSTQGEGYVSLLEGDVETVVRDVDS